MNLTLPPDRDLPDPDGMFASILAGSPNEPGDFRPANLALVRRRRRTITLAVAAGVAALALGVAAGLGGVGRTAVPPAQTPTNATSLPVITVSPSQTPAVETTPAPSTPQPSPSTSWTPKTSASGPTTPSTSSTPIPPSASGPTTVTTSSAPSPAQTFQNGPEKATFPHLTVELKPTPTDQSVPVELEFVNGYLIETCVTSLPDEYAAAGKLPVSLAPFSSVMGTAEAPITLPRLESGQGLRPAYPGSAELAPGECVRGFVSFDRSDHVDAPSDFTNLIYQNSLGDRAVWTWH